MCGVLCALLGAGSVQSVRALGEQNACLQADAKTEKQVETLAQIKKERFKIADPNKLKPWMVKVNETSQKIRKRVSKGIEICRNDEELGMRARAAALSRLRKRQRQLNSTDNQMMMMHQLADPQPKIDASWMRVLERSP